jgi:hypothetical protein
MLFGFLCQCDFSIAAFAQCHVPLWMNPSDIIARVFACCRASINHARSFALVCCWIGFALSAITLDARSLWGDEAFSVWASKQPALALMAGLDAQPPLYHLMLSADRALFGESVFAIRFVSLVCAVLLIAVGWRLAQRMAGVRPAIVVALFLATSPMLIYFAQEARMYSPAALFAGGAMLLAYERKTQDASSQLHLASYVSLSLAALFTHFYTVGVLAANSIALGIAALRSRNLRRMVDWVVAHGAIALIFGGWFFGLQARYVRSSAASRSRIVPEFNEILSNVWRGIEGLWFGLRADGSTQLIALGLFALALLGVMGYWWANKRGEAMLIGGWIALSLGLVLLTAGKTGIVSDFSPRYFLFAVLPLFLGLSKFVSQVIESLSRVHLRSPLVPMTQLLIYSLVLSPALFGNLQLLDTSWQKSRYDALVADLRARSNPGDAVVMVNSDQFVLMDYYGPTNLPQWIVDNNALNGDAKALNDQFTQFTKDAQRVWLVNYGWAMSLRGSSPIEQMLAAKGVRTYAQGYQDVALALYDLQAVGDDAPITPQDITFDNQIKLTGVRNRANTYRPGDALTLDLFWRALQKPNADYTVFMHLRRASDGGQIAAFDSTPVNGTSPTSSWSAGQSITDTRAVQIPADAAPGEYDVIIGWYLYPSFERLTLDGSGATEIVVSTVRVE